MLTDDEVRAYYQEIAENLIATKEKETDTLDLTTGKEIHWENKKLVSYWLKEKDGASFLFMKDGKTTAHFTISLQAMLALADMLNARFIEKSKE
jgi:hypothetical protein